MTAVSPAARADLVVVSVDGESVVYDERNGSLHHLNQSAALVFRFLDGRTTSEEIAADIADVLDVSIDDVRRQVGELLVSFREAGLLEAEG